VLGHGLHEEDGRSHRALDDDTLAGFYACNSFDRAVYIRGPVWVGRGRVGQDTEFVCFFYGGRRKGRGGGEECRIKKSN
jgi:hypothetical protein